MLTKIIEGYEYLGVVSTIDPQAGLVRIRGTGDTVPEISKILKELPFPIKIVEIEEINQ